jgi:hypothetical protein
LEIKIHNGEKIDCSVNGVGKAAYTKNESRFIHFMPYTKITLKMD